MKKLNLVAGVLVAVLVAGCAAVPISTMFGMRNFGLADFLALDPGYLRVATQLPQGVDWNGGKVTLSLKLTRKDGSVDSFTLPLREIALEQLGNSGLPSANSGMHWQAFMLTDTGVAEFRKIQVNLSVRREDYKGFTLNIQAPFTDASYDVLKTKTKIRIEIWLRLTPAQGFFELLNASQPLKMSD